MLREAVNYPSTEDKIDFMINTSASSTGATLLGTINRAKGLAPVETGADGWYYYEFTIPAAFNTATNYIIMKAISAYGDDMHIDDASVIPLLAHDVGTLSVDVNSFYAPGSVVPKATVKNFGANSETFPVTMTINPGGYTSTMNVTALTSGTTNQVTFTNWVATNGTFTVKVFTQAGTDLDRTNDTLTKSVVVSSASWTTVAPIPTTTYFGGGVGYSRNDSGWVFVVGGNGSASGINNLQIYNVKSNTWSAGATLSQANRIMATAILKDSLYSIGGVSGANVYLTTNERYDIRSNTWVLKAPLPSAAAFGKAVGYQDSLIYFAGGTDGTVVYSNVWIYNAKSNTWRTATPLPATRFGGAFSRSGDTLVYVGGADLSVFYATTYRGVISQSDRSVITWTTGANFPAGVMYRMDAHQWGSKGIILTGGSNAAAWTAISAVTYSYSPGANTWAPLPNKPTAWTCGQSGSVSLGGGAWKLVCATGYNGTGNITTTEVFTDTLAVVGVEPVNNTVPETYSLSQNYPNPFNPSTNIKFAVPQAGNVKMVIFDVMGREVATLVNEFRPAGNYAVDFNASALSSGVYFYRINAGNFTDTKKMILIK
jgi:N-acetylneuraminic acid mutarotase